MSLGGNHRLDDVNNSVIRNSNLHYGHNLASNDRLMRSRLEQSFIVDQQNAKELQQIQNKALELRQKQRKYRTYFLKLKKLYEQKLKQFHEYQKISSKAIQEKTIQIQLLTVEIESLKQEKIQMQNLKDERDILLMKNQQFQQENIKLTTEIQNIQLEYSIIKNKFDEQSELIDNGIRQNLMEEAPDQTLGSISDALNTIKLSRRKSSEFGKNIISENIENNQIINRTIQILQNQLNQKNTQIVNLQSKIDGLKIYNQNQGTNYNKNLRNYQHLERDLLKIFQSKALKEHFSIYQAFTQTTKQIFNILLNQQNQISDRFCQNIIKIVQDNITKLNEYFKTKAQKDIEVLHKMMGYMKNAGEIIQKTQDQYEAEKDTFNNVMSPERINFIQPHSRQLSHSSASSYKKSIVLEQDLENAISDQYDKIKEQTLQMTMNELKESKIIQESINESNNSSMVVNEGKSDQSFSKSKMSSLSQAEQEIQFKKNEKNAKLKGKLKKRR